MRRLLLLVNRPHLPMSRPLLLGATLLLLVMLTWAAIASPPDLREITYTQRMGNMLPGQAVLSDEHGATVRLLDVAGGKPLIMVLGYFHCANLCGLVRADLLHALEKTDLVGGRDYQLVSLSIDPAETPRDAAAAKTTDMTRFPAAGAAGGWHFLTGRAATL
ncbi:MAG: SCO family protein, partial [Sinobacteraceae bacterium]|nr:SCO family protein [Nevskiaceae bacterium]